MRHYGWINVFAQSLRVVLLAALMLLVPPIEAAHSTPVGPATWVAEHQLATACDMTMPGKVPLSHGDDGVSCRILCLGWVQASDPVRPEAPVLTLIAALPANRFNLPDGISISPIRHPPKLAPTP